jgi:hypothetical protein
MDKKPKIILRSLVLLAAFAPMIGCRESESERLARMAEDATQRQAEQNQELVRLNRDVAEAHKRLVDADGTARQEVLELQRELAERHAEGREGLNRLRQEMQAAAREERSSLDRRQEDLEQERRELAAQREREPIVAAAITGAATLLACLMPLLLCGYLLYCLRHSEADDAAVTDLLIREVMSDKARFPVCRQSPPALPEGETPQLEHDPGEASCDGE